MTDPIIKSAPTQDEVLTASLKLVVDSFVNLGYEDNIIFGKVNLILNKFITPEGTFTPEYIALAENALRLRATKQFAESITATPEGVNLIVPQGIGGNKWQDL